MNFRKRSFLTWLIVTAGTCAGGVIVGAIWDYFMGGDHQIRRSITSGIVISTILFFGMSFPEKTEQQK